MVTLLLWETGDFERWIEFSRPGFASARGNRSRELGRPAPSSLFHWQPDSSTPLMVQPNGMRFLLCAQNLP